MAITPIALQPKEKRGGGLFGKIAGGLVGAVAGLATGNPLAVLKGATGGAALGGMIGGAVKPDSVKPTRGVSTLERAMSANPGAQIAMISEGQNEVKTLPGISVDEKERAISELEKAKVRLRGLMG